MRLTAVLWDSLHPLMVKTFSGSSFETRIYANRQVDNSESALEMACRDMENADLILLYRTTHGFWDAIDPFLESLKASGKRIICVGQNPVFWALSTVEPRIAADIYRYLLNGTEENFRRLIGYLEHEFLDEPAVPDPPLEIPWQGLVDPRSEKDVFDSLEEYLESYPSENRRPRVAVIISRSAWISGQNSIEKEFVEALRSEGLGVITIMTNSLHNEETGSLNISECLIKHTIRGGEPVIDGIVKLVTFMAGKVPGQDQEDSAGESSHIFTMMDVPVFQPVISYNMSLDDWKAGDGLTEDLGWGMSMPEMEGCIDPIMLGATRSSPEDLYERVAISGRCGLIAKRIKKRLALKTKPASEKKVVLILNNSPCSSAEANIGSASGLDSMSSTVAILRYLKEMGLSVECPEGPEELRDLFLSRKAMSEFRWTPKEEILRCGGAAYMMPSSEYGEYFNTLPESARDKMISTWGEPPGESMVMDGRIIISGLRFGNAIVAVQPKRGCFGPKCDGTVCKILHDPLCPPPHQYLAAYHFFRDVFGADAIIHIGTHGTVEFLPGKGTGMSEECFPDICNRDTPTLYVYNTDNPPEGTVAKRRCYATLIGHMQTAAEASGLYGGMIKLDSLLFQYDNAKGDRSRQHALHHMILDAIAEAKLPVDVDHETPMDEMVRMCHEFLSGVRNSRVETGMHIFGNIPEGKNRVDMISSILRYDRDDRDSSPRRAVADMMGIDYETLLSDPSGFCKETGTSNGAAAEWIDGLGDNVIEMVLNGNTTEEIGESLGFEAWNRLEAPAARIADISYRMDGSDEMGALENALAGGYTRPGPSGYMTRGRDDVLPTGRNFHALDPKRVPTTSSWRVGERLADALLDKFMEDEGRMPESIAFQWMTSDVMAADGEMLAEMMSLIGTEPVWGSDGHVSSFRVIDAGELRHPRIDLTVRISGILRDTFPDRIDLLDSAIRTVAALDEPPEVNFVRKHFLEDAAAGVPEDEATARIFSSRPGTYTSGVSLAILSGAWKDEKDLAQIYISVNGYAYGNGRDGRTSHEQFASGLKKVELTFNKVVSDEHDLLGCCCYYSNQGGMTAASKHLSGKEVRAYFGDTREADAVGVRTLADELQRVVRSKLLNPKWIEGMKGHGYKGAADMMKKITRVYGWEASTGEVDDRIFDDIADTYVNEPEMKEFFQENNPYALEEISRRLLEAESRGLWDADPEVLDRLRESYLEVESWMEDLAGSGEFQGGSVEMTSPSDIEGLGENIEQIMEKVRRRIRE